MSATFSDLHRLMPSESHTDFRRHCFYFHSNIRNAKIRTNLSGS
ncbi:hypothetical protein NEICINOT_03395 [Neisseria cinerea ATCC 14685]|uniref:Uncharacterized protein n=1 Tax=Neisseria cinerea ATCC 14685 TaxID=546262 RepID=D0W176_NEICI|nr:hypothetical protein NEICINOT_03395 [Neisseria cinerea ATCC 14685]